MIRVSCAFAAGAVFALAAARLTAGLQAQSPSAATIRGCVGADGVVHLSDAACAPSQRPLVLGGGTSAADKAPPDGSAAAEAVRQRIRDLEARIRTLEDAANRGALASKVKAPFEVTSFSGKPVFTVGRPDRYTVEIYNSAGTAVAFINATERGGNVGVKSAAQGYVAAIGAGNTGAGVTITDGSAMRIDLGPDPSRGNYRLKFLSKDGNGIGGIGQSAGTSGIAYVADVSGAARARMYVEEGTKGTVAVLNDSAEDIGRLTVGASGGGYLVLASRSGEPMVDAGSNEDGVGLVRTGPGAFKSGLGLLGLPGSFLMGKK